MIGKIAATLATLAVLVAAMPAEAAASSSATCTYSVVVLSSAPCNSGTIQYTCGANNCFVGGSCSVSGTSAFGLSCTSSVSGIQLVRDETILISNTCTAVSILAVGVTLTCTIFATP